MKRLATMIATLLAFVGCSGGPSSDPPTVGPGAAADQRALEQAMRAVRASCDQGLGVGADDLAIRAIRAVADRPRERLPNGRTPRTMANAIIDRAKECAPLDAEFVEMMLTPRGEETSFERARRERNAILAGDASREQALVKEACKSIEARGEEAARREFVANTPSGDLKDARWAFSEVVAACGIDAEPGTTGWLARRTVDSLAREHGTTWLRSTCEDIRLEGREAAFRQIGGAYDARPKAEDLTGVTAETIFDALLKRCWSEANP